MGVEDAFGKTDVCTMHSDKIKRDNKGTKEFHKFRLCFDIVDSLPSEFDKLTEDLLLSITTYVYEPTKSFEEWTKEACENACTKGHTVLFKEKIVPQLTQAKKKKKKKKNFPPPPKKKKKKKKKKK